MNDRELEDWKRALTAPCDLESVCDDLEEIAKSALDCRPPLIAKADGDDDGADEAHKVRAS